MEQSSTFTEERQSMRDLLTSGLKAISDSGNPLTSKLIMYFGVGAGVGGGTVQTISKNTNHEIIEQCAAIAPDWLAYIPAIGVASLVIKNACDIYFKRLEVKRGDKE